MRPTRKRIKFDEDSLNELMQELYDDSHNIKAKITRLFTKWELKVKEGGEIAAIGDQIVKLIAAEAKNQDQKIMLLKFLKEIVFDKNGNGSASSQNKKSEDNEEITSDERNALLKMVKDSLNEKKVN
jgi:hypothetical protein